MTPVAELTHSLSVAGQIQPEDVQALASTAIRSLFVIAPIMRSQTNLHGCHSGGL